MFEVVFTPARFGKKSVPPTEGTPCMRAFCHWHDSALLRRRKVVAAAGRQQVFANFQDEKSAERGIAPRAAAHTAGMKVLTDTRLLCAMERLLEGESLAAKKARVYSRSLLDPALAGVMERLAARHAARFSRLYAFLEAKGGGDE